jgi:hypothetical protein
MAKSETQNITMVILRHWPVRNREIRSLEQLATGTRADKPVNVKRAEQEEEGVDRTEDHKRDRRRARRQERRHGLRGSQHAIDHPGLTADLSGEPAGDDRDERQRKAQESQPKQRAIVSQAVLVTQVATKPGEPQHHQTASHHDPKGEERDDDRRPVLPGDAVESGFRRGETVGIDQAAERRRQSDRV